MLNPPGEKGIASLDYLGMRAIEIFISLPGPKQMHIQQLLSLSRRKGILLEEWENYRKRIYRLLNNETIPPNEDILPPNFEV